MAAAAMAFAVTGAVAHAEPATPSACTAYGSVTPIKKNANGTLGIHLIRKSCSGLLYYRAVVHNYTSSTVSNRTVKLGSCATPTDGISAKPAIGAGKDWTSGDVIENLYSNPSTVKGLLVLPSGATDAATACA